MLFTHDNNVQVLFRQQPCNNCMVKFLPVFFVHVLDYYEVRYKLNGNFISIASNGNLVAVPNPAASSTYFWERNEKGKFQLGSKSTQQFMCRESNNYIVGFSTPLPVPTERCQFKIWSVGNGYARIVADNGKYLCLSHDDYIVARGNDWDTGCYFEVV